MKKNKKSKSKSKNKSPPNTIWILYKISDDNHTPHVLTLKLKINRKTKEVAVCGIRLNGVDCDRKSLTWIPDDGWDALVSQGFQRAFGVNIDIGSVREGYLL